MTLDGSPLASATIEFTPADSPEGAESTQKWSAAGGTDDHGHFVLYTVSAKGAQPGNYVVHINKTEKVKGTVPGSTEPAYHDRGVIPAKYGNKSILTVEIGEKGNKDLHFDLSSK